MPALSQPIFRAGCRRPQSVWHAMALAGAILLACPLGLQAAQWTTRDKQALPGELVRFEFEEKLAVFQDAEGRQQSVPSSELSADSRWRLLVSPAFARSFPSDRWTPEQTRFLVGAITGPVILLLVSFYACAILLLRNANPLRAVAGWVGSAVLGGFLMGFYLVLSGRQAGSAAGILGLGALISTVLLSLYVSAIYRTTVMSGLKLLALHVFAAFFLTLLAVLAARRATQVFDFDSVIAERIMIPVGLLPAEPPG